MSKARKKAIRSDRRGGVVTLGTQGGSRGNRSRAPAAHDSAEAFRYT